jgi:hypothetical protein
MWWHFAGRSREDVVRARGDTMACGRVGRVGRCGHGQLSAPALPKGRGHRGRTLGRVRR